MTTTLADAFDLVAHTELLEQRLAATLVELSKRDGLTEEKSWLEAAHRRVAETGGGVGDLLTRVLRLSELEPLRGERGRALQGAAVDALEQLQIEITAAGGDRSPLLEVIYRNLKTPWMRRCGREDFEKLCVEIEKRLASSYAKRMLADPSYAVLDPHLQRVRSAFAGWRSVFQPASDPESRLLRDELELAAARVELPCRQARLLAEAALLSAEDLRERSGIFEKPKRRAARLLRADLEADGSTATVTATALEAPEEGDASASAPGAIQDSRHGS